MCGIVGGVLFEPERAARLTRDAPAMLEAIAHRGRDGRGLRYYRYEGPGKMAHGTEPALPGINAVLGHLRLAVIDTSDAGLQPMSFDPLVWISYNGEVYNFVELRQELEAKGHRFSTATDTEVMLAAYREWGVGCVERFNGMFAFALLDGRAGKLLLARDPLGIKPLYYWRQPEHRGLLFASEIKSILATELYEKRPDWGTASHYFTFLYAPHPSTAFKDVRQLPPGHWLEMDLNDGTVRVERYWRPRRRPEVARLRGGELDEALRTLLGEAVGRQMRSDVPIGSFLSGGVDSTVVTGLMTRHSNRVKTYTITFPDKEHTYFDEADLARATARHLGTEHHELPIRLDQPELIFRLIDHFDQPFGNPTYYMMYLISRQARDHITVALCGAGGDELYGGYPRYRAMALSDLTRWIPLPLLHGMASGLRWIPDSSHSARRRRIESFFGGLDRDAVRQYLNWTYYFSEAQKGELLRFPESPCESSLQRFRKVYDDCVMQQLGDRLLELDVQTFLVDNLLEYTDKMSMAVPLEMRVPLLDHEFVEFSLNVPFGDKLNGRDTKLPLKRAFREFFTPDALNAPKKGFIPPLADWMKNSFDLYFEDRPSAVREMSGNPSAGITWRSGLLDKKVIDRYRDEHRRGMQDWSYELFAIMIYDLWYGKHFS